MLYRAQHKKRFIILTKFDITLPSSTYKVCAHTLGVLMASPEVGTSCAKLDVAFFGWVWLIVESGDILKRSLNSESKRGNQLES